MNSFCLKALITLSPFACAAPQTPHPVATVGPGHEALHYNGRLRQNKDSVTIFWPGTTVRFKFRGTGVKAYLRDERGENYFNVVIDQDSLQYFKTGRQKSAYVLAENLRDSIHTLELVKRTEWDKGKTWFYGLQIDGELLQAEPARTRTIEFFGNSITAGYAIEDYSGGDSPDSTYTNNYATYAAITARYFNANYYCTVKSGIGILVSWFPLTMPEMYDRLDPEDPQNKWDFSTVQPQVVVVNLFQNDSWLINMPDHESFKQRFGAHRPDEKQIVAAYKDFIIKLRNVYPQAHIICALGCMDAVKENSPWPGYVSAAVKSLADPRVYTHFFPFLSKAGHPREKENREMAESLISFIENNIEW
ncbi:MAG TPA: hypothetical protein VEB86_02765 [Chryseosolibacter sp.]|nr:hypothetical protein [Chryseosolibacter sp.]